MEDESRQESGDGGSGSDTSAKIHQPYFPPEDGQTMAYWQEINEQTDRGAAILAASFVEWRLRGAIKGYFAIWDSFVENIFGSDSKGGRLGFWEQAQVAYGLGVIGKVTLLDLKVVCEIRNKFAHHPTVRSFDHVLVNSLVDKLKTPGIIADRIEANLAGIGAPSKVHRPRGNREKYTMTTQEIANAIWVSGLRRENPDMEETSRPWTW